MSKITSFDKANLSNVRASIDAALSAVAKEYGLTIKLGGIKFTETSFNAALSVACGADDPMMRGVDPKVVSELQKYRDMSSLFMAKAKVLGEDYTVVGMKPRSSCLILVARQASTGALKLVPTSQIRAGLVK